MFSRNVLRLHLYDGQLRLAMYQRATNMLTMLNNVYVRPSQNLPLPLRIYSPFQQLYTIIQLSQNLPLPPRIFVSSGSEW